MPVAEPGAHPALIVRLQVEDEQAPARPQDADRFGDGALRVAGVVQRLREQRDVERARRAAAAARGRPSSTRRW